ncbi:MAG: AIR synthase-related protein, partial [Planctomycetota bacterium]
IVLLASRGVQTNGLSLCRKIAEAQPDGYLSECSDGRSFGESLLDPSVIYTSFIAACREADLSLHYTVHLTGHGWRKLMRLDRPFVYRMTQLPEPQPVFDFIEQRGPVDRREMWATFNMGAGFAAYLPAEQADRCAEVAKAAGYTAWIGGTVEQQGDRKAVEIEPEGIVFEADTLQVR